MAKTRFGSLDGIHKGKSNRGVSTVLISAALFILILIGFLYGIAIASSGSEEQQRQVLEDAIDRSIVQCYVTEGRYPMSLDYLQENYGIIYDDSKFRIDYVVYGANMKPEVTIISLEGDN